MLYFTVVLRNSEYNFATLQPKFTKHATDFKQRKSNARVTH